MAQSISLIYNNWISGELSPLMEGRIDSPRYQTGVRTLQNLLPDRKGCLRKRPGTYHAGTTYGPNAKARLMEMTASDGNPYIVELTATRARIWDSSYSMVATVTGLPYSVTEIFEVKYAVQSGYLWLAHRSYAPRRIFLSGTWQTDTPPLTGTRTFASTNNYPGVIFFYSGRLGLASTNTEPTAIFLSKTPDATTGTTRFTDFTFGTADDDAIYLLETDVSNILWALGQQRLVLGTKRSIWMDTGQGVTPAMFDTAITAYTGASEPQAVMSETITLYIGRGGKSLHAIIWDATSESYQDVDLSQDAEHFLNSPIVDMKIQCFPEPTVWLVRTDGLLVSCSLNLSTGMIAWARHPMGGSAVVESIAMSYGTTEDILWLSVLRGTTRTIEYLRAIDAETTAQADFHYVDCGLAQVYSPASKAITGLSHLEGVSVAGWGDGGIMPKKTVTSGAIAYDTAVAKLHVGYPIESEMETLRPETPANGTSQGKQKALQQIKLRLYRSLGGEVSASTSSTVTPILYWVGGTYVWGATLALYTDTKPIELASTVDPDVTAIIDHNDPAPFNILALICKVAIMEA